MLGRATWVLGFLFLLAPNALAADQLNKSLRSENGNDLKLDYTAQETSKRDSINYRAYSPALLLPQSHQTQYQRDIREILLDFNPGDLASTALAAGLADSLIEASVESGSQAQTPVEVESANQYLVLALIVLSLTTLVSLCITFYLYKWRKILLSQPNTLVPEKWAQTINNQGQEMSRLAQAEQNASSELAETRKEFGNLKETIMVFQNTVTEKDKEIERLKSGYDAYIFESFLRKFIRLSRSVDKFINNSLQENSDMQKVKELLEDALEECGLEGFTPAVGDDYRKTAGVADSPTKIATHDKDWHFKIARVIAPGYKLISGEREKVIAPATVEVYVLDEGDGVK